jgi:hypothetical protein
MRAALLAFASLTVLALAGCGEPRQVGEIYVQGDVTSYNYYGEFREKREGGRDRIFLMFDPATVKAFAAGAKELPVSKSMIGKGPNKETIVLEQLKDPAQSAIIAKRLITTFNAKNNAAVPVP